MTKRTKENLGFLLLGGTLSFIFCEWTILERGTKIEQQAEIIDAYDLYWHTIEDQDMLNLADRFDYYDSLVINYNEAREKLIKVTNRYESNPNHKHQ
jgi:hypothetical protein